MQLYAVMGSPIAHSKSPLIHKAFAQQFNIELTYEKIVVESGKLATALQDFKKRGGCGVNITLPLKEEAYHLVADLTERAKIAKAINTIIFKTKNYQGDNTDGVGLLRDLKNNHKINIKDQRILMIGAGGAARGVLAALLAEQPACLVIANRTNEKAKQLIADFNNQQNLIVSPFQDLRGQEFHIIINATSAGTKGESLHLPSSIAKNAICYDLAYGKSAQPFLAWAKKQGAALCVDGLGMLVEQAAEAFYIWHGKLPDTKEVIEMLLHAERNNGEISYLK